MTASLQSLFNASRLGIEGRVREFYDNAVVQMNHTKCLCGRSPYLWGGDTCDVCDTDGNGLMDKYEPTGIGPTPQAKSLFSLPEKGWAILRGAMMERIPRNFQEKGWEVQGRKYTKRVQVLHGGWARYTRLVDMTQ